MDGFDSDLSCQYEKAEGDLIRQPISQPMGIEKFTQSAGAVKRARKAARRGRNSVSIQTVIVPDPVYDIAAVAFPVTAPVLIAEQAVGVAGAESAFVTPVISQRLFVIKQGRRSSRPPHPRDPAVYGHRRGDFP